MARYLAALLDPCGANTLELDQEQEQEQVQKHVQKEESPVHDAYESEDVPEFSADQMQAFIDFTISNLVKNEACKGLTEEYFAKAAKKLNSEVIDMPSRPSPIVPSYGSARKGMSVIL